MRRVASLLLWNRYLLALLIVALPGAQHALAQSKASEVRAALPTSGNSSSASPNDTTSAVTPAAPRTNPSRSPEPLGALVTDGTAGSNSDVRPWAVGVPPDAQQRARTLFAEGTEFLLRSLEEQAIAKYDEALRHWNHPGIHYNYAVALSTQDRAIETRLHLLEALRYGDLGPLDNLEAEQARRYLKLVEDSLALVDIQTNQPGVIVTLNGQLLFTGPGRYRKFIAPDEYLVAATKPGYISTQQRVAFLPGKPNRVNVQLYSEQELTRYRRRWPLWGPVTVTAVSGLALLGGGFAAVVARGKFDDYDTSVSSACPAGCTADDPNLTSLDSQRTSAERYDAFALPMLIGGGVGVAAGAMLLYLNRAEAYRISPAEAGVSDQVSLFPLVTPKGAALVGQARF